jgi:hypothetical protein
MSELSEAVFRIPETLDEAQGQPARRDALALLAEGGDTSGAFDRLHKHHQRLHGMLTSNPDEATREELIIAISRMRAPLIATQVFAGEHAADVDIQPPALRAVFDERAGVLTERSLGDIIAERDFATLQAFCELPENQPYGAAQKKLLAEWSASEKRPYARALLNRDNHEFTEEQVFFIQKEGLAQPTEVEFIRSGLLAIWEQRKREAQLNAIPELAREAVMAALQEPLLGRGLWVLDQAREALAQKRVPATDLALSALEPIRRELALRLQRNVDPQFDPNTDPLKAHIADISAPLHDDAEGWARAFHGTTELQAGQKEVVNQLARDGNFIALEALLAKINEYHAWALGNGTGDRSAPALEHITLKFTECRDRLLAPVGGVSG